MVFTSIHHYITEYNRLYKTLDDIYRATARRFNLSECALWILYSLSLSESPMTQKDLCEQMLQAKQSINSSLKRMEEDGLITLRFAENSRKLKIIELTDRGRELAGETSCKIIQAEERAFGRFSAEERTLLFQLLKKNTRLLKEELQHI